MSLRVSRRMLGVERTLIRQIFDAAPRDAIQLGLGQPDLPTPPAIALAGTRGIAEGRTAYTSTAGDPELRAAIARRYPEFARGPEAVAVTVGSQEALFATLLTLVDPGDEVLVPDPGYPAYPTVCHLVGARAVGYPLREDRRFRLHAGDVLDRVTAATRAVVVCSPANPTGAIHTDDELAALAAGLGARGIPWVSDELYAGFAYDGGVPSLARHAPEGGVVLSGLSKDLSMTGWRIGWAVAREPAITKIIAAHQYLVTCAPTVSQTAAIAALGPAGDAARAAYLEIFRRRREIMAHELARIPRVRFELPDGAFYFFVAVDGCTDSLALCRTILEREKVVTIPGIAFGPGGEGYVRLSYAAPEDRIEQGVRAIGRVLRDA